MQFKEIYENLDNKIKQYIESNNLKEVPHTNTNNAGLLELNEFTFNENSMLAYCIYHDSLKLFKDAFPFDITSVSQLEQFLKNVGHLFVKETSDSLALEKFNKSKDIALVFIGNNSSDKDFFAISFKKYDFFIYVTEDSLKFCSGGGSLRSEIFASNDINVDFNLALDDFCFQISEATSFVVNEEFQENINKSTMSERINNVFAEKGINDIVYTDKEIVLKSLLSYQEKPSFKVGFTSLSFYKEDHEALLLSLKKLFYNDTYETLVKIVTAVINYQKLMHREEQIHVSFPIIDRFYDFSKLPFLSISLNEKYKLGFSTNGYIFTNNAVPQYVKDYSRLPEVLNKILEECSRHASVDTLTKLLP